MKSVRELMNLAGRTVVITGGAGHIGRAMASALAELGASVAVADLHADACQETVDQLVKGHGIEAEAFPVNLADEPAVRELPGRVADRFGGLDVLVNCAAFVGTSGLEGWVVPFEEQSSDTWRKALEVNLSSVFVLTQSATPYLKKSGRGNIINISSIYGVYGPDLRLYEGTAMGSPAAYAASKGGLIQFTRWCATVLAPDIRVNAITPGGVFRDQDPRFVDRYIGKTPLRRMAKEEDFKGAVCYLASDLSAYVTGQNLVVDGGFGVW
ncbi:MAG: SDR family oxidoreductase [Pontiellaceae bacterium]|nr:SDR family oxidoreductase [Pontiellaceae bacterium]